MAPITIVVAPHAGDGPLKGAFPSLLAAALDPGEADWARGEAQVKVLAAAGDKNPPRNFEKTVEALAGATGVTSEVIKQAFSESSSIDGANQAKVAKVALRLAAVAQELRSANCAQRLKLLPRPPDHETLFKDPAAGDGDENGDTTDIDAMTLSQVNAALGDPAQFSAALVARRAELTAAAAGQAEPARTAFELALAALDIKNASAAELEAVSALKRDWEAASKAAAGQGGPTTPTSPAGSKKPDDAPKAAPTDVATMAATLTEMVRSLPAVVASAIAAANKITIDHDDDEADDGTGRGSNAAKRRKTMVDSDGKTGLSAYLQLSIISPRLRKLVKDGNVDVSLVIVAEGVNGFAGPGGASSKKGLYRPALGSASGGKMELIAMEDEIKDTMAPETRLQAFFELVDAIDEIHPDIGINEYKKVILSLLTKYKAPLVWQYDHQARFAMASQLRDNIANPTERALLPRMSLDDELFKTVFNGVAAIRCAFCSSKTHWSCEHSAKAAEWEKEKSTAIMPPTAPNPHSACCAYNDVFRNGTARSGKFRKGCTAKLCPYDHICFKCGGAHTVTDCP